MEKFVETIYTLCSKYDKQDVDKVLNILNEKDKREIELRYGTDLEHPKRSSEYTKENGKYFIYELLPKVQDMLKNKIFNENQKPKATIKVKKKVDNYENIINKSKEVKKQKNSNVTLLQLFQDVKVEHLQIVVKLLAPKYRDVIYLRHSKGLNEFHYFGQNYKKYNEIYDEAIVLLDDMLKDYHVSFMNILGCSEEQLNKFVECLKESQLNLLHKIHGNNLDCSLPKKVFNKNELISYEKIINTFNKSIEKKSEVVQEIKEEVKIKEPVENQKEEKVELVEENKEESKKTEAVEVPQSNISKEDLVFKKQMYDRYSNLLFGSLSTLEIEYLIDLAIKKYDDNLERESFILGELYHYLERFIRNNINTLERINKKNYL